ncbi:LAMI_0G08394g1_1 [Lachancea mirantina]|uniref:GPI inositol-deacylase n=1 Tax=Lachancea mirantina TaxID=1230905 RepID=A0A1G4K9Z6_9SACH|nr:LAMI_0G08394g1_1 [Lachancea mirantina]
MGIKRVLRTLTRKGLQHASFLLEIRDALSKATDDGPESTLPCDDAQNLTIRWGDSTPTGRFKKLPFFFFWLGLVSFLIALICSFSGPFSGADSAQCRGIYMYPAYARITGFDTNYSRLAKKYHLYLYREQGKDREPAADNVISLDGIPVLFIPGNAGSFKQVRSIAAAAAELYFENKDAIVNPNARNLDVFTADFNEDFTAFHGRTMLDQAEYLNEAMRYILTLYESSNAVGPPPRSVLILGHSMGGVVARVMPTLKNYVPASINTIITLSSPHAVAPATFDGDIIKIYDDVNEFWVQSYENASSSFAQNVSLISITGGILDTVLPADYTIVEHLIPYENGFTTYTTTIPGVWTPVDHLAIVWCDQLRKVLARLLLEIVDFKTPYKTIALPSRMREFRKHLLTGLESYTTQDLTLRNDANYNNLEISEDAQYIDANEFVLLGEMGSRYDRIFELPKQLDSYRFTALYSDGVEEVQIFFCKAMSSDYLPDKQLNELTGCLLATSDFVTIPSSAPGTKFPADSSEGGSQEPYHFLHVNETVLSTYEFILLKAPSVQKKSSFFVAELSTDIDSMQIKDGPLSFLFTRREYEFSGGSLFKEINFPHIWNSLISYRVSVNSAQRDPLFQPILKQSVERPFETKWHVDVTNGSHDISFHSIAPFVPIKDIYNSPLKFSLVCSPESTKVTLSLEINWHRTFKLLFLRYRLSVIAFAVAFTSLVIGYQFYQYQDSGDFMSFESAAKLFLSRHGMPLYFFVSILTPLTSLNLIQRVHGFLQYLGLERLALPFDKSLSMNAFFLGMSETFMWWLGPFLLSIVIFALITLARLIVLIEAGSVFLKEKLGSVAVLSEPSADSFQGLPFSSLKARNLLGTALLILSVFCYVPYQFALVVMALVQVIVCLKAALAKQTSNSQSINLVNYNNSFLLLLLFVVPINVPIVIVFLHNLAIRWETPFSSHHNFLSVLPAVLLIEKNAKFSIPKIRGTKDLRSTSVVAFLFYLATYSFLSGTRNLYWLHHLFNLLCAVIILTDIS